MEGKAGDSLCAAVEAILFASGEPITVLRIAQACETEPAAIQTALEQLAEAYAARKSAVCIRQLGECWQMCTQPEYAQVIQKAVETKKAAPLSTAAMETLTIVAYNQPVSKGFVEHIRGVDSGSVVNTLVEKELLTEVGRLDVPGHPIAYGTTPHFLRCFGLRSLDDLPSLPTAVVSTETEAEQEETALYAAEH